MSILKQLPTITTKPKRRCGRGIGSTLGGHTSGRGTKGQKARRGSKIPLWFEGGQLPLIKRLPMLRGKGLLKPTTKTVAVTLGDLNKLSSKNVTLDTLKLEKLIPQEARAAKVIATGKLTKALKVTGLRLSAQAQVAIEQAGGTVEA